MPKASKGGRVVEIRESCVRGTCQCENAIGNFQCNVESLYIKTLLGCLAM